MFKFHFKSLLFCIVLNLLKRSRLRKLLLHRVVEVVVRKVKVLERAIFRQNFDEFVHMIASHAIPADVKLLQVSRAPDQLHQLLVVRLIQVDIDQTQASNVILCLIEGKEQVIGDFSIHLAVA